MTDKEREELAEVIGKGLASGSKISAEDLQNENTISYKMGEIMEMDADFVTLLNFVDWYSPTKEVNEKLTKMLRHIAGQTYQNQTKVEELETQIEKMKCCGNCKNEGDYKEPYRYGTGLCNICKRHKVAKGNFDKWEIKEK